MATITVSNQREFDAALDNVRGGDTILLQAGNYASIDLASKGRKGFDFGETVTIASADPRDQAKISQLLLRETANVEFRDLVFDYSRGGSTQGPLSSDKQFWVESSVGITFDGITFDGEKRSGYGDGLGLRVKDSEGVSVLNSTFDDFEMAISMSSNTDTIIAGNKFRGISFDTMMLGGMDDVTIAYNEFTDFHSRHLLHQDVIQFVVTKSMGASNDIKIVGNVIDNPEETHGIYLGNSLYSAGDMDAYYKNVYIADNIVHAADKLAILVMHGDNVVVEDNVLTKNNDEGVEKNIPLINISRYSKNVYILDNEVQMVQDAANGSWVVSGNKTTPGRNEVFEMIYSTTNVSKLMRDMPDSPAQAYRPTIGIEPEDDRSPSRPDPVRPAPVDPVEPDDGVTPPAGDGIGAEVRLRGNTRALYNEGVEITGLDFAEGDELIFGRFERQTFRDDFGGNYVNNFFRGQSVRIDSMLDIQELKAFSPAFDAYSDRSGDLVIEIKQDRGVAEVTLTGLGSAFDAAYQPDLF